MTSTEIAHGYFIADTSDPSSAVTPSPHMQPTETSEAGFLQTVLTEHSWRWNFFSSLPGEQRSHKYFSLFAAAQEVDVLPFPKPTAPKEAAPPALLCALLDDLKLTPGHRKRESWSRVFEYRTPTGRAAKDARQVSC